MDHIVVTILSIRKNEMYFYSKKMQPETYFGCFKLSFCHSDNVFLLLQQLQLSAKFICIIFNY